MPKLSIDNPFLGSLVFIFFGMLGYFYHVQKFGFFDFSFLFLMSFQFVFIFLLAEYIERKRFPKILKVNPFFSWFVLALKVYFLLLMISAGPVNNFDDRLSIYGSSFLLGVNNALTIFLFPLIPALTKSKLLSKSCVFVWVLTCIFTLLYAPSKGIFIQIVFSLLFYRFLKRKILGGVGRIGVISGRSLLVAFFAAGLTFYLIYMSFGVEAVDVLIHRVAYNYDIAIYISQIYQVSTPDNGIFYYAILPFLKQINPDLYSLDFFSLPQWVVYESLGIERYGRFGYPNDNFVAGILVSYGVWAYIFFVVSTFFWSFCFLFVLQKEKVSIFLLYFIFQMPRFYSSLQDFAIYLYVVAALYFCCYVLYRLILSASAPRGRVCVVV